MERKLTGRLVQGHLGFPAHIRDLRTWQSLDVTHVDKLLLDGLGSVQFVLEYFHELFSAVLCYDIHKARLFQYLLNTNIQY